MTKSLKQSKKSSKTGLRTRHKYVLYAIGTVDDLECELDYYNYRPHSAVQFLDCYIGVTRSDRMKKRWGEHNCLRKCRKPAKICFYIKEHQLTFENNVRVIFEGTQVQCLKLEYKLRPNKNMSLNTAIGGGVKKYRVAA